MNAGFFGATAAIVVAAMFLDRIPLDIRIFLGVWLVILGLVNYAFDHSKDADRISRMLKRRDGPLVYTRTVQGLLGFLQRVISPKTAEDDPPPKAGLYRKLEWWITPRAVDAADLRALQSDPWSWPVFRFALKIAIFYPIFFAFIQWVSTGQDTGLGQVVIFPGYDNTFLRYIALVPTISVLTVSLLAIITNQPKFQQALETLIVISLSGCGAFALFFLKVSATAAIAAGASSFSIALAIGLLATLEGVMLIAIACGIAIVGTGPFSGMSVGPAILIPIIAGISTIWVAYHTSKKKGGLAFTTLIFGLLALLILAAGYFQFSRANDIGRSMFLFFGLFPIINSLFDFLSYGLTIQLIQAGLKRKGIWTALYGALDLTVAMLLFLALSATLIVAITIANRVSGTVVYDLADLFVGVRNRPEEYRWVFGMVFSTLIPTLVHLYIVALSALTWLPAKIRLWLDRGIAGRDDSGQGFALASVGVAVIWTAYTFVITLGVVRLALWVWGQSGGLGWWYLDRIETFARWLGAI